MIALVLALLAQGMPLALDIPLHSNIQVHLRVDKAAACALAPGSRLRVMPAGQ
jgi:hypothetical protein